MDILINSLWVLCAVFFIIGIVFLFMRNKKMKLFLITSAVLFVSPIALMITVGATEEVSEYLTANEQNNTQVSEKREIPKDGEKAVVNRETFLALNEGAYKEMMNYVSANNVEALERMISTGMITLIPQYTEVTVVNLGILKSKVEVISTGQRGFIITEMLDKK